MTMAAPLHMSPQGPLVYVNYGRLEDFLYLNRTLNLSLEGHICIARYGEIFRGDKVVCVCVCVWGRVGRNCRISISYSFPGIWLISLGSVLTQPNSNT